MQSEWRVYAKRADFKAIGEAFHIDQVTARILVNRGITTKEAIEEYLNGDLNSLHSPELIYGMNEAVEIIRNKIAQGKKIRIVGDYDVDGICSTTILYKCLSRKGADVSYIVPDRIIDGYGINERLVQDALNDGVDTILTCDNGIAAVKPVAFAKEHGMTVIVTDHHEIPFQEANGKKTYIYPDADVIVNVHQEKDSYPFKDLCGAGVALKLATALGISEDEVKEYAELVGIASVCDVVALKGENRILVKYALKSLPTTVNTGLQALQEATGLSEKEKGLTAFDFGFVIGPSLNATGRLDSAMEGISLLLETDYKKAQAKALEIRAINEERKQMTEDEKNKALEMVENSSIKDDHVLVVLLPECHQSLAGIVAGRLKEEYYRPTLVLTLNGDIAKGSGRSIEAYDMFEKLSECKELFTAFGGHKMAAGFSLKKENVDALREALNKRDGLTEKDMTPVRWIDVPMPLDYATISLVEEINALEPFGAENEKPTFADRNLLVRESRIVGKNRNVCRLRLETSAGFLKTAVMFGADTKEVPVSGSKISMLYYPNINEYMGNSSVEFIVKEFRTQS